MQKCKPARLPFGKKNTKNKMVDDTNNTKYCTLVVWKMVPRTNFIFTTLLEIPITITIKTTNRFKMFPVFHARNQFGSRPSGIIQSQPSHLRKHLEITFIWGVLQWPCDILGNG